VLSIGMHRARTLAEVAHLKHRHFTPHSRTNGIGVLANLHVSAGVGGGPYFEYPYEPPGWTPERRDFMLAEPVAVNADGDLKVPQRPGRGIELDGMRSPAGRSADRDSARAGPQLAAHSALTRPGRPRVDLGRSGNTPLTPQF
jgi:hypothetical protein